MLVACTFVAGSFLAGLGGAAAQNDLFARIQSDVYAVSADVPDAEAKGTITQFTANGPVVREITREEFLQLAERVTRGKPVGDVLGNEPRSHPGPTVGYGNADAAAQSGWYFCDYASVFTYYAGSSAGESIVAAVPSPVEVSNAPVCGGWYGPTENWAAIQFAFPENAWTACAAAVVMLPDADRPVGSTGGYRCNQSTGSAHGAGALYSISFFGLVLDYFLGADAYVTVNGA